MVMIDPERIQRLAAKMGNRNDALEFVRQMRCGGKMYPGGGKFFRTDLQNESPMMYRPMPPMYHELVPPMRFRPEPDNGNYVPPVSTGMVQVMPIGRTYLSMVPETGVLMDEMERPSVIDLFSDEAKARRALKQRYAESAFDDRAVSKAGAQGAWQIMPITLKDYLGRGRGRAGDLNDPEYNRRVRDWVMGIIPRDLKEFWSESDSDRAKLAKLYAAYNWGAGNLRSFLRKKRDAGVDISNPDNWVDDLNPETRRYVKYLAFDEDIPDSIYTNSAFEDAARKRGYMANGGKIHIKPENRGKFTALKKRTGHSASWFKAHGTPAQKKMAVFALNAKKWKHENGGYINRYDGETESTGQMERVPNWVVRGQDYSEWKPGDIQEIINWGYTDPYSFFGAEGESTREALSRAGMADSVIADIYRNAPEELQKRLGDRYKGTVQRQDEYNQGIRDYTNYVAPRLGAAMAGSLLGAEALYYLPEIYGALAKFPGVVKNAANDTLKWFATPEGQRQAWGLGLSMAGGMATDKAIRDYTPYNSWGDALYSPIRKASDYIDEQIGVSTPEWMHKGNEFVLDFTNPGYYISGLAEPVARGISNAAKNGLEKMRMALGRSPEYEKILSRMSEIERESASLEGVAKRWSHEHNANPGYYELPVTTVTEPFGTSSSSSSLASAKDVDFVTHVGGERIPVRQVVDDIGLTVSGAPSEITYPVPSASLSPMNQRTIFFSQYDPSPSPDVFSTAHGKNLPMAQDVERKPMSLMWTEAPLGAQRAEDVFQLTLNGSASIPVQRGVRGGGQVIKESLQKTESMLGDAGFVAGSTPLYAEDILSGVPGDTEIVATKRSFPDVVNRLKIKNPHKINEFAYNGTSPELPGKGEVDIQLIEENANGEAVGGLAWSYFRNLHPLDYNALLDHYAHVKPNTPYKELPVINPRTGVAYTPDELASEAKGNRLQHIVDEAIGMNRDIRRVWNSHGSQLDKTLKYNRSIGLLTNKDPMVRQMVRKAIDTNAKAELGQYYVHGSEYFPNIDFANVEVNKEFLKKFNIDPKGIADDPEMMKNIFDMWFLTECSQVRMVEGMNGYRALEDALFVSNHAYNGGDFSGGGLNTLKAGVNRGGRSGSQRGIMQVPLSLNEPPSDISSIGDAYKFTRRLARDVKKGETPRIISDKEYKALTDELDNIINDFSSRYVSGGSNFDLDGIIVELKNQKRQFGNVKSLRRLDDFFRTIGRYPDPYSREVIDRMAKSIDLPGMFTNGYDDTYFGKLIAGRPAASTIKIVDPGVEKGTSFEVGKLLDSYAVDPMNLEPYREGSSGTLRGWAVADKIDGSKVPGYGGRLLDAVQHEIPPEAIEEMGAKFVRTPESKKYIEALDELSRLSHEYDNLSRRAEELEKYSRSGKAIENAEMNTRYSRDFIRYKRTGIQRNLSANEKRGIKDAIKKNQSLHGDEKIIGFTRENDGTIEVLLSNGERYKYSPVSKQIEDADLPFALGGYMNRINSKYGNDPDKIRQILANVRSRQKK